MTWDMSGWGHNKKLDDEQCKTGSLKCVIQLHDDVIKCTYFQRKLPFMRGIGQWCGALMLSLICAWINDWVNNRRAGDLRRHRTRHDVTVMGKAFLSTPCPQIYSGHIAEYGLVGHRCLSEDSIKRWVSQILPYGRHRPFIILHNQWHGCSLRGNVKSQGISSNAFNLVLPEYSLQWRHNGRDSVSNHQLHDCFLNLLFRCRSKKTSKLRVTGLCVGNSPGTPSQFLFIWRVL